MTGYILSTPLVARGEHKLPGASATLSNTSPVNGWPTCSNTSLLIQFYACFIFVKILIAAQLAYCTIYHSMTMLSCITLIQFNSIVYFRQKSIHMYIIYKIKKQCLLTIKY